MTGNEHHAGVRGPAAATSIDPVCGMRVDPAKARASYLHEGQTYYFCCPSCKQRFEADPGRYLAGATPTPAPSVTGPAAVYTCPMHPEVRQDHPGSTQEQDAVLLGQVVGLTHKDPAGPVEQALSTTTAHQVEQFLL